jgi:hypothetical protein
MRSRPATASSCTPRKKPRPSKETSTSSPSSVAAVVGLADDHELAVGLHHRVVAVDGQAVGRAHRRLAVAAERSVELSARAQPGDGEPRVAACVVGPADDCDAAGRIHGHPVRTVLVAEVERPATAAAAEVRVGSPARAQPRHREVAVDGAGGDDLAAVGCAVPERLAGSAVVDGHDAVAAERRVELAWGGPRGRRHQQHHEDGDGSDEGTAHVIPPGERWSWRLPIARQPACVTQRPALGR